MCRGRKLVLAVDAIAILTCWSSAIEKEKNAKLRVGGQATSEYEWVCGRRQ
jgi:hypothetical protein